MTREQLIGAIAALEEMEQLRNIRTFPLDCIMHLRCKYRAQLAALPEPTQPWTDRERRLREALVNAKNELYGAAARANADPWLFTKLDKAKSVCVEALAEHLAEAPTPNPRDEALEAAEKALTEFLEVGKLDMSNPKYEGYWCGLSEALAAIARAKGGHRE